MDRVLVLGDSGKLGQALRQAFRPDHEVIGASGSQGLDGTDFRQVEALLERVQPRWVLNAIALNGLDACERDPALALVLNSLLPRHLAKCAAGLGFHLVHFSSDAVFDGRRLGGCYTEADPPSPINVYGLTKFGGDQFVLGECGSSHLFRLSILAGRSGARPQFLERMIAHARSGQALQVAQDIVCSPSYVADIAHAVRRTLVAGLPPGLYHLANHGQASLYEVVREMVGNLGLAVPVEPVPHTRFPSLARKNERTPLGSLRLEPLRDWREAIRDYCSELQE
jgi:dTDP-4-dehydrorhamnose reductase